MSEISVGPDLVLMHIDRIVEIPCLILSMNNCMLAYERRT